MLPRILGGEHPTTISVMANLANMLSTEGTLDNGQGGGNEAGSAQEEAADHRAIHHSCRTLAAPHVWASVNAPFSSVMLCC